ncbi:MAG: hypothetical protein ACHP8B_05050 [Terriglobales bacterium]
MKSNLFALGSVILGGLVFWTPEILFALRIPSEGKWLAEASFAGPLALLAFCAAAAMYRKDMGVGPSSSLFALVGIWLTAPWLMLLGASLQTSGMFQNMRVIDYAYLCLMSVLPPLTLWTSAMHGSAYGLILATIVTIVCHRVFEKGRWLIPPDWKRHLHFPGYPTN